jgi:outer membrane protein TolC
MKIRGCARTAPIVAALSILIMIIAAPTLAMTNLSRPLIPAVGLDEAIQTALDNNRRRPASRFAVAMAEAQHKQALSAYWPQLSIRGSYQRKDEAANFLFPANSFSLPAQSIPFPPGTSIPLNTPMGTVPLAALPVPAQNFEIPAQDVKIMDEDSYLASLQAQWLLYDGGMRRGHDEQAQAYVEMMKQDARRTDLEIIDSVKRYYYGAVLAGQIHQVGADTLARMEATLNLTEAMYKEGGGQVKKTDWLDNKVMVESLRAMVALLEKNELMSQAALANTMGLPWNASIRPVDRDMPFHPFAASLDSMIGATYQFNPDWAKIEAGIRAADGAVRTARSGHFPKVALTGELHKWWNDYDAGLATDPNKEGWSVGLGIEIPLFDGFLTTNRVAEARARAAKIQEEKILLQEGLGLQVRDIFLSLSAAEKAHQATLDAMDASVENRDLNTRAYQHGLVETEKVIQAQLMEALMSAQHYKARYDHLALQSRLDLIVGGEVLHILAGK